MFVADTVGGQKPMDFSGSTGISFYYSGPPFLFAVNLNELPSNNTSSFACVKAEWFYGEMVTINWEDLTPATEGTSFSPDNITSFSWLVTTYDDNTPAENDLDAGDSGSILIDDVQILGLNPVAVTKLTVQPISDAVLAQNKLHANPNPSALPIASASAGDTLYLEALVTPSNATYQLVQWSSSDESVATVDQNGRVLGVGAGNATITARSKMYSTIAATYSVAVKASSTSPTITYTYEAAPSYCENGYSQLVFPIYGTNVSELTGTYVMEFISPTRESIVGYKRDDNERAFNILELSKAAPTTYYTSIKDGNGTEIANPVITIKPSPTVTCSSSTFYQDQEYVFINENYNSEDSYRWDVIGLGEYSIVNNREESITVKFLETGDYQVSCENESNGCFGYYEYLTVSPAPVC
ncbi:MAG: Ig-like domain-containing protein, partial [Alphaproteobacteria bacterium]|nr:Ig-like domain-containing protein [Alphaproteobacteria bacterium]